MRTQQLNTNTIQASICLIHDKILLNVSLICQNKMGKCYKKKNIIYLFFFNTEKEKPQQNKYIFAFLEKKIITNYLFYENPDHLFALFLNFQ